MRTILRPILAAGALLVPGLAVGAPVFGSPVLPDCSDYVYGDAANGELYALKLTSNAGQRDNDWLFDLRQKGEGQSNSGTQIAPDNYNVDEAWAIGQGDPDVHFIYITYPPTGPGQPARIFTDSGTRAAFAFGLTTVQEIGNSLPLSRDAGIGLTIPGTSAQFMATLRTGVSKSFPVGATPSGSATAGSVNIAFAPVAEVNPTDAIAGTCQIAGNDLNPRDTTRGGIIGYNVYRIPGVAATVPTHQNFMDAVLTNTDTDGGWVYFLDLRTFNVTTPDTNPGAPTPGGPDQAPTDLAGLQNPDGRMYSGDEVMIYQDNANNAGVSRARAMELAPVPGQSYWYAIQPVVFGSMAATLAPWSTTGFGVNDQPPGDKRRDLDGDGEFDAINLDAAGTPEFISPQAEASNGGQAGLGLTVGGILALSAPMFYNGAAALPAHGQVSLSGSTTGNDVNVQFTTGLEKASVLGYNVYRVSGEQRVRVNEQPILAQGNESNVYTIVDAATRSRGVRTVSYMVEIVYSDGTPSTMVGPFAVSLDQEPARRRR